MPTGSFDLSPVPGGIATQALPIYVCLYSPGSQNPYTVLPNVRCLRIDYREGPDAAGPRFQYLTDDLLQDSLGWPAQFEQLWPIDAQGKLCRHELTTAWSFRPQLPPATKDGKPQIVVLFDGFAQVPQADLSAAPGDYVLSRSARRSGCGTRRLPIGCSETRRSWRQRTAVLDVR